VLLATSAVAGGVLAGNTSKQVYFGSGPTGSGVFPNGTAAYLWTAARVSFDNGAILSVINGLGSLMYYAGLGRLDASLAQLL